jgi:hypothetical protein
MVGLSPAAALHTCCLPFAASLLRATRFILCCEVHHICCWATLPAAARLLRARDLLGTCACHCRSSRLPLPLC